MRNQFPPVFAAGAGDGRRHEAEVAALVVGADEELIAVLLDFVLLVLHARRDDFPFAGRLIGGQETRVAGGVAAAVDDEILMAARALNANVKALVGIFVGDGIAGDRCSQRVTVHAMLALGLLFLDGVEQGFVVGGPGNGADLQHFSG